MFLEKQKIDLFRNWLNPSLRIVFLYLLMFAVYIVCISSFAFIHFFLHHDVRIIEEWVFDNAWKITIISKIVTLGLIVKFFFAFDDVKRVVKGFFEHTATIDIHIVVFFSYWILSRFFLHDAEMVGRSLFSIEKFFWSYLGTFVFFATDYALIKIVFARYPFKINRVKFEVILVPILFFFFNKIIFKHQYFINSSSLFVFLVLGYFFYFEEGSDWKIVAFLFFVISPFAALVGGDYAWENRFTLVTFLHKGSFSENLFVALLGVAYLHYARRPAKLTILTNYILNVRRLLGQFLKR